MNAIVIESNANRRKIDTSHFANAVYLLELMTNFGNLSQKEMIAK